VPRIEWGREGGEKHRSSKLLPRGVDPALGKWKTLPTYVMETVVVGSDPDIEPHVAFGHEAAHYKLGHVSGYSSGTGIGEEVDAWNETIYNLMGGGEWTPRAKKSAILALSSYFEGIEDDPKKEARGWINRAEDRAKRLLGRYSDG